MQLDLYVGKNVEVCVKKGAADYTCEGVLRMDNLSNYYRLEVGTAPCMWFWEDEVISIRIV